MSTLTLHQIIELRPDQAIEELHRRALNPAYASHSDLYIRLFLLSILQDKCEFDVAHITTTIAFFKTRNSIPVAALVLKGHTQKGNAALKHLKPTDAQLESVTETSSLVKRLCEPDASMVFPTWVNFKKFTALEVERALVHLREVLLSMRIPSKRKPKRDIELDADCTEKLKFSRESIKGKDHRTLYLTLQDLIGEGNMRKEFDSPEFLQYTLQSLFDKVIQEEKYSKTLLASLSPEVKTLIREHFALPDKDIVKPKLVDEYLRNSSIRALMDIADIVGIEYDSRWRFLAKYDEIIDSIKKALLTALDYWNRSQYSVKDIFSSISMDLHDTTKRQHGVRKPDWALVNSSCVVSKTLREEGYTITEIGLRCDGVYVAESISADDSENHLESKCGIELQWFPNRDQREKGKSLDTILAMDNTMARNPILFIVFLCEGNQYVLDVNAWRLTSEHVGCSTLVATPCHTLGQLYTEDYGIPDDACKPLTPFKRVVIQVRPTQEQYGKLIKQLETTANVYPVSTTAEVLADALAFTVAHADLPFDHKVQRICEYPNLLFQLPDSLRKTVFHGLAPLLESYWKKTVLYDNKYDSLTVKEAKKLLCELIAAGHDQTHVALVSSDHLRYVTLLIAEKTKHTYQALSVEKSNFHTIFRTIERINKETAISFCSVHVSGKLSGLDISRLVDQSIHGNVRILLVFTPQVLLSLQLTQKVDSVRVPASLRRAHQIKTCVYTASTVIGKLVMSAHEKFSNAPIELSTELGRTEAALLQRTQWREDVKEWISRLVRNKEVQKEYKLVVCEDMPYVKRNLDDLVDSLPRDYLVHLHTVDCHEVDAEVELAGYFTPNDEEVDIKKAKDVNFLVLLNAHLLSEQHRHHIASIAIVGKYNLIMVMPSYSPDTVVLQIKTPNSTLSKVLQGTVCRPLADWDAVRGTTHETEKRAILMFFGPLAKTSLFDTRFSPESAKSHLSDTCEFLKVDSKIINSIIDTIFASSNTEDVEPPVDSPLHSIVAHFCVRKVLDNVRNGCLDVSFFHFLTHSHMSQWLPQIQRVVAWTNTLLPHDKRETWGKKIASWFQRACVNIHSAHIIAAFAEGYHQTPTTLTSESLGMLPSYQFVVTDNSITQEELILQQCNQGCELNWEHESLESCSLDFVLLLVEAYFQPLKLLVTLQPLSLFHMLESATSDRFPTAVQILESSLVALTSSKAAMELFSSVKDAEVSLSVLKWSLLSTGCISMDKLRISTLDVCNLINARIPISVEKPDTAQVIVALFLALDGPPGIIYQQTGLRELLLSESTCDTVFLTNTTAHLGMAALEFAFDGHVRKQQSNSTFLEHPFLVELVLWLDNGAPRSSQQSSVVLRECWRLSECAVAYFIAQATSLDASTIEALLHSYLQHIKSRENADVAAALNNILASLLQLCPGGTQVARIICEFLPPDILVLLYDPLLDALVKAIQKDDLTPLEEHFRSSPPRVHGDKRYIPVESSPKLVKLLLQQYSDAKLNYPNLPLQDITSQVLLHRSWLSENGQQTILDELVHHKQRAQKELRMLTFLFWLLCPSRNIPFFPDKQDLAVFKIMVDVVDLASNLQGQLHQASQFAKYLVAPYCLDLVQYNFFCKIMDETTAEEKVYLVAMEDHVFPLFLHVFPRTLPHELYSYYKLLPFDLEAPPLSSCSYSNLFGIDVSSGVDESRIHQNLFALRHIVKTLCFKQNMNEKREFEDDLWFLAHIVLAWFWAMGYSTTDVDRWLNRNNTGDPIDIAEVLGDHEEKIRKSLGGKSEFKKLTTIPLPHLVDVKVRLSSRVLHLMGSSMEDKSYTEHYFSSFLVPLGCDEERLHSHFSADYANVPEFCGKQFGALLGERIRTQIPKLAELPQVYEELYHRNFLEIPQINSFVTLCQPFAAALQDLLSSDPRHASTLLKASMQAIARFPSPLPSILCHILFLSFPVTSPLVGNLVACIRDAKVKLCAHCCEELENYTLFMRETPLPSFNRSGFELEYFKGRHADEIPKITPLGEPCHYPIKYSSKLLQSSLINQQTPQAPIHISHLEDHSHPSSISTDFFCGSHSGNKPHTVFLQKTKVLRELPANRAQSFSMNANSFGGQHPSIFFCHDLLKVDPKKGYAVFFVAPGGISYLMRDPTRYNVYHFHTGNKIQAKKTDKDKIAAAYANHDEAWTDISKHAPPSSLIVLAGILFFKSPAGTLDPYIISFAVPPEVTQYFHRKIYFFDVIKAAPYLGLQFAHEMERFLLLLCRWLFRLCMPLHRHEAKEDTRERVTGFFAHLTGEGWSEGDAGDTRKAVEKRADMIGNYLLRLLPQLSNNRAHSIVRVIKDTAQESGQHNKWDSDILEVWPAVVKALQRHLQYTISYHPLIISILNHTLLENHELMAQEALRQCALFVGAIQAVEAEELKELVSSPTVTAVNQFEAATTLAERVVLDDGDFSDDESDIEQSSSEIEVPRAAPASIPDTAEQESDDGSSDEEDSDEDSETSEDDKLSKGEDTSSDQTSDEDEDEDGEGDEDEDAEESASEDAASQHHETADSTGIPRAAAGFFATVGSMWNSPSNKEEKQKEKRKERKQGGEKKEGKRGGKAAEEEESDTLGATSGELKDKVTNKSGGRIQVNAIFGKQPALYLAILDPVRHKNSYEPGSGKVLGYILHQNLYSLVGLRHIANFTVWLLDVFRSPLTDAHREWFLARCQEKALLIPPEPAPPINSLLVAHCLASTCPKKNLRSWLLGAAVGLPEEAKLFISRKNNEYGVHFCTSDALRELKRLGLYVEVLDFSHVGSGTKAIDDFYLQVISRFTGFHCFVYVRGLDVVEDLFLKWCCEYTHRCPWRFIYFENTDSTFNFPENRDRCSYTLMETRAPVDREKNRVPYIEPNDLSAALSRFGELRSWVTEPRALDSWIETIKKDYYEYSQCIILNVSPPGAGKSHLWNDVMTDERLNNRHAVQVDCSNDELVERSMASILHERFPQEGQPSLLIADEFHMLSSFHKEDLIGWVSPRLHWLKVVLVANRSDNLDTLLLDAATKQLGSSVLVKQYDCRLSLEKIKEFTKNYTSDESALDFVETWHRASRMLFSEESLSLRSVGLLLEQYRKQSEKSDTAFISSLAGVLDPKMPFLGKYCCTKFAKHLWDLFSAREHSKEITALPKDFSSPIGLLVKTALADARGELCSFPEFASRMKVSHIVHPIARIAAWVRMVWTKKLKIQSDDPRLQPLLSSLTRLQVTDQAKFPYIVGENLEQDLSSCDVYSKSGNFADLAWLVDAINHGNAINWKSVKDVWKTHHISSAQDFSHLLSVCPDPGACLDSVFPRNLCTLIEGEDGTTIAESCVQFCSKAGDSTNPHSVYFTAAWNLFKNAPLQLEKYQVSQQNTLLWASQFAFSLMRVKENPIGTSSRLQQTLFELTRTNDMTIEKIAALWSHLFAGLLTVGESGISNEVALLLSRKVRPIPSEWPEVIKLLAQVEEKTVAYLQLEKLYDSGFFAQSPVASSSSAPILVREIAIPDTQFCTRLLELNNRTLSVRWQAAILTSDLELPASAVAFAPKLEEGLASLADPQKIRLRGPLGEALRKIKQSKNGL